MLATKLSFSSLFRNLLTATLQDYLADFAGTVGNLRLTPEVAVFCRYNISTNFPTDLANARLANARLANA
jgi:hypothetical protein